MVAATGVHTHRHGCRLLRQRPVDQIDIGEVALVGITGCRTNLVAIGRIAKRRKHGVVDLQVGAAKLAETTNLFDVDLNKIVEELFGALVDVGILQCRAQTMQHAGRGDRQLRGRSRGLFQECEILAEDGFIQMQPVCNLRNDDLVSHVTAFVAKRSELNSAGFDAADTAQKSPCARCRGGIRRR